MKRVRHDPAPDLSFEEYEVLGRTSPGRFLKAFLEMSKHEKRYTIGFDHESLAWISTLWDHAAIAAAGKTRLRDACLHEKERYRALCNSLKRDMHENGQVGCVFLDTPSDWPDRRVIKGAIKVLADAGVITAH